MDPRHNTQPLATRIIGSIRRATNTWPDPEASTGEFVRMMGRRMCFRATGPALDAFTRFSKDTEEYLNKFSDALPETVLRTPYMIGTKEKNLRPTVLFSSRDQDAREKARKSIQESGILQREGFLSMTCNRPPEFPSLMTLTLEETETTPPGSSSTYYIALSPLVRGSVATQVSIFDATDDLKMLATATGGGILEWDKRRFLMTAAHVFQAGEKTSLFTDDANCDFEHESDSDDFSDEDEDDDDEIVDTTSRGSKTSEEDGSDTRRSISADLSSTSSASLSTWTPSKPVKRTLQIGPPADVDTRSSYGPVVSVSTPTRQSRLASNTEETLCSMEGPFASSIAGPSPLLDYALIEITGHQVEGGDVYVLSSSKDGPVLEEREAVEMNGPSNIIALTASKGSIKGRLTGIPSFGTAPNSTVSQELWTIHLDGELEKGDCGCWIVDAASGAVYGHIIAGSPGTGIGLIAPLTHVFKDLVERFDGDWRIGCRSGLYSTSDPQSSPGFTSNKGPAEREVISPALHGLPSSNLRRRRPRKSRVSTKAKNLGDSGNTWNSLSLDTSISGSNAVSASSPLVTSISGLDNTWLSFLNDKKHDIKKHFEQDYPGKYEMISDGISFRFALGDLTIRMGEYNHNELEANITSFASICSIARTLDLHIAEIQHLAPNDTLQSLIWRISFAMVECGYNIGAQLIPLVNLITALNEKVPWFSFDLSQSYLRFANEERIQKPLQDVYSLFIDSHLFIISHLRSTSFVARTTDIVLQTYVNKTARRFEKLKVLFDVMMSQAAEDEERKILNLPQRGFGAQRALPGHLHQDSTSNQDVHARFLLLRCLGTGYYSDIDEVRELSTGASYARKHIFSNSDKSSNVIAHEVRNEVVIMQKLRHLHIATVLFYLKEENGYSIFMLPVADYDLGKYLSVCTTLDYPPDLTKELCSWFGCLLDALAFAHKLQILHKDIKPSNILIKNNEPFLSDFGLAQDLAEYNHSPPHDQKVQGSLVYRAPEIGTNGIADRSSDVFSLGCVYSEMFTVSQGRSLEQYHAFRRTAHSTAFRDCLEKMTFWLRSCESNRLNDLLVNQILRMTSGDAAVRPSAEQTMESLKGERSLFCVE